MACIAMDHPKEMGKCVRNVKTPSFWAVIGLDEKKTMMVVD
jgi:hypothetical protein